MKTYKLHLLTLLIPLLLMCRNAERQVKSPVESQGDKKDCFLAIDGQDSAFLSLAKDPDGQYTGKLMINYQKQPDDQGKLAGTFSGDTLMVNYSFYLDKDSGRIFTNPLAMLKKGDSLILGSGKILTSFGRSYLKKSDISFDRGRFRFVKVSCK